VFSSFLGERMFSGVSITVLHSQVISTGSLRYVISLLKQTSSEDFGSKSELMLIASISVAFVFKLWFGKIATNFGLSQYYATGLSPQGFRCAANFYKKLYILTL
jgi:hypothetical protein